jgi:exodeoxyribonuclease X
MNSYTIVFFDTETTGNTSTDRLCQLSYLYRTDIGRVVLNELFKPPIPITFEAMAVHHITNVMTAERPLFVESPEYSTIKDLFESDTSCVVAHNAQFDLGMLSRESIIPKHHIDTLKIIRYLDPDIESGRHSLQYLRYFLDLDSKLTEPVMAHDAFGDVLVLELLFERLTNDLMQRESIDKSTAIQKMITLSSEPMYIGKLPFGKYKGMTLTDIAKTDSGYLVWLLNEKKKALANGEESEKDWIYSIEKALGLTNQQK